MNLPSSIPCKTVNIWGFQRIISGPNKGGYSHKLFVRDNESLCCMMPRQKIKGGKHAKPRAYYPFKEKAAFNAELCASIEDEALNILLREASFPTNNISLNRLLTNIDNMHKDMTPFSSNTVYCQRNILATSMDGRGHGSTSSTYEDDGPSSPARPKRPFSPLTFGKGCDTKNENLMQYLEPDPIAPDHPLSKNEGSSTTVLNQVINSTIDDLVHDDEFFSYF